LQKIISFFLRVCYTTEVSNKKKLLEIHARWIKECPCTLRESATQPVPGFGNPDSEIVFIGEAPGKDEDKEGRPFVGRAGKLLTVLLEKNSILRKDVYITNVVKFRPPDNRDPNPDEITDCLPWLMEELNCIQPKIIVPLGRHALNRFFPNEKISDVHGKLLHKTRGKRTGIVLFDDLLTEYFFPLYHPAAALYGNKIRETLEFDFRKLPLALKSVEK